MGYLETSVGIGLVIGPVLGSLMYSWLGYKGPFLLYGLIFLIFTIFLKKILPEKVDIFAKEKSATAQVEAENGQKVTFCAIFSKIKVVFACFSGSLYYFAYSQLEPILALRLQ